MEEEEEEEEHLTGCIEEQLQDEEDLLVQEEILRLMAEECPIADDYASDTEVSVGSEPSRDFHAELGLSPTLSAMFERGPNAALCSSGLLKESDWEVGTADPSASSTSKAPAWGMGDLVRASAAFLGLHATSAHFESLADKASNDRRIPEKAKETTETFNQMAAHVGHTPKEHLTDSYALVNAAAIAAAREQMEDHGRKNGRKWLKRGAFKRLREQPDLLAMTGLQVKDDTPLEDIVRAEVRLGAVVNTRTGCWETHQSVSWSRT